MTTTQFITTPRGAVAITRQGKAELVWATDFTQRWNKRFSKAQMFIDSEVLRLAEPFTPLKTGMLVKSGILGTVVGSGLVSWIAPYSRWQYYLVKRRPSETGPLRGGMWFHRVKELHRDRILRQAKIIAGAK